MIQLITGVIALLVLVAIKEKNYMTKKMLIDASHPEETRVVVLEGKKLEDFDVETTHKKLIKGNIYLAKVIRIEPSLQAAFVEYGGNKHGFLPFSEIHPDYYRIPVEDRLALQRELEADRLPESSEHADIDLSLSPQVQQDNQTVLNLTDQQPETEGNAINLQQLEGSEQSYVAPHAEGSDRLLEQANLDTTSPKVVQQIQESSDVPMGDMLSTDLKENTSDPAKAAVLLQETHDKGALVADNLAVDSSSQEASDVEIIGGVEEIEANRRIIYQRLLRRYKIQEVIKRRQVMLVQVTKEEKANKGAAITTYISLAGRYCVLMPNAGRSGGGVSRKITSAADRKRLKSIIDELEMPKGMAIIIRTAGSERSKSEIRRDCEYLTRLWEEIRELTIHSSAPALVYEEANLIKRAVRDLYSKEIEEVIVSGEEAYKTAKSFMRVMVPSHARRVQIHRDDKIPLFQQYDVESQLLALLTPRVQLRSGGYIVINHTEALVAIDVNSGRATRERHIEETALKTNLEAADEIARQIRLRDLSGLIVIDFIDMETTSHNQAVEKRLKEAMRADRARIQIGRISSFGLLELSRQRMRPSLLETNSEICHYCGGTGHLRSTEAVCLDILRQIESDGLKKPGFEIEVTVAPEVATYVLNNKRHMLADIEKRHQLVVTWAINEKSSPIGFNIAYTRQITPEHRIARVAESANKQDSIIEESNGNEHIDQEAIGNDGLDVGDSSNQEKPAFISKAKQKLDAQEVKQNQPDDVLHNDQEVIADEVTGDSKRQQRHPKGRRHRDQRNRDERYQGSGRGGRHRRDRRRNGQESKRPLGGGTTDTSASENVLVNPVDNIHNTEPKKPHVNQERGEVLKVLYSPDISHNQISHTQQNEASSQHHHVDVLPVADRTDQPRQELPVQERAPNITSTDKTAEKPRKGWWRRLIS